ncbi:MAG: S-adenosylmethionine:tRNA ribosyltransferase-isomerase, partial [Clostridia bacterium]
MKTSDFYYDLPQELIAQTPLEPRDSSRMLVYNRKTKNIEHKHFYDLPEYLHKGDLLVINNTKVLPARIYGSKDKTGGKIEFLLLKRLNLNEWEVILKPGRI